MTNEIEEAMEIDLPEAELEELVNQEGLSLEEIESVQEDYRTKNVIETGKIITKLTVDAPDFYPTDTNIDDFIQEKANSFEASKTSTLGVTEDEDEPEAVEQEPHIFADGGSPKVGAWAAAEDALNEFDKTPKTGFKLNVPV